MTCEKKPVPPLPVVRFSDEEPEELRFLWEGWILDGGLTLCEGPGGSGKSTVLMDLAARVTNGDAWPGESGRREPATVLWIQAEEMLTKVLIPRFMAAGGDRSRIITLPEDVVWCASEKDRLLSTVEAHNVGFVVIDPIKAYQGNVDDNSETSVRPSLQALNSIGIPVVGVRHWKKGDGPASERGAGSTAYRNVARGSVFVAPDPDDPYGPRRFVATEKTSAALPQTTWEIEIVEGETIAGRARPVVRWLWQRPDIDVGHLTRKPKEVKAEGGPKNQLAQTAILDCLREHSGEAGRAKVVQAAVAAGAGRRTAATAIKVLKGEGLITAGKDFGGNTTIRLQSIPSTE